MNLRPKKHYPAKAKGTKVHTVGDNRPSSHQRGYDQDWYRLRNAYIAANPMCEVPGCTAKAAHVDHRTPVAVRPDLRLVWSNLQSMCKPCHSRKTVREDGGFGRKRKPT